MPALLSLATLALLAAAPLALVQAVPCVQFDTQWNLYAFGGQQDVALGQSSSWGAPQARPLTTTGRPPWTGNATQCLLSQFNNAMYVLGADASDFSKVYVYSFGSNAWSTQSTTNAPPAPLTRSASVLDHDTNVVFTFSNGGLTELDMSSVTASATGGAIAWDGVSAPSWGGGYTSPTAAQASNHIMYFGAPNTPAGQAQVFVVHYAYFQPQAQAFPASSGSSFPASGGQAVSVPDNGDNSPNQLIFIPTDFSSTYVVNHWTNPSSYASTDGAPYAANLINTTQTLPAPPSGARDAQAAYAASPSSLVQITTGGDIYYIANAVQGGSVQSGAEWVKMGYSLSGSGGSGASASASAGASASGGSSASAGASGARSSGNGGAGASTSASGNVSGASGAPAASSSRAAAGRGAGVGAAQWGLVAGTGAVMAAVLSGVAAVL